MTRRRSPRWSGRLRGVLRSALALSLLVGTASAHEIHSSRFESPIPLGLLFAGAGLTVAVTAFVSARYVGGEAGFTRRYGLLSRAWARRLRTVARALAVVLLVVVLVRGFVGPQVRAENVATVVVWPLWLDGLALLAALVGSPWRVLSPWRTAYDALCRLEGEPIALLGDYPDALGRWPAMVGFVALVGVLENLSVVPRSPRLTALLVAGYALYMLVGALAVGETFFERADPVGVFLSLFQRVAPLGLAREDGYALVVRAPWRGCVEALAAPGAVAFVVTTVFTVSFDGFTSTPSFQGLVLWAASVLGLPTGLAGVVLYAVGLLGFVAAFLGVVRTVAWAGGGHRANGDPAADGGARRGAGSLARAFAPTLLPIAVGYEFAHYSTYVVTNAGQFVHVVDGWFVAAPPELHVLAWLSLPVYWGFEVLCIVVGHVVAVVAAHYVARGQFDSARAAWRAHLPLVVLMVGYTVLSLWIVSRPVVA